MRIGELWGDFLASAPTVARKIAEAKVSDHWAKVAGNRIAMYTSAIKVDKGVVHVSITSASARSEAFARRATMKEELNAILGMDVVRTIIVK